MEQELVSQLINKARQAGNIIVGVFLLCLATGCTTIPAVVEPGEIYGNTGVNQIYVVGHGWHTGFVIEAKELQGRLPQLKERFGHTPYIEIGWGDKGFYQAKEITVWISMKAIFWPSETVVHAVAIPSTPKEYFPQSHVKKLTINDGDYDSLLTFIVNSFEKDKSGGIISLGQGLYGDSQFYSGTGKFHLMNTCNKWTAKGLKSSGMDISPMFRLTADSVISAIEGCKYLSK